MSRPEHWSASMTDAENMACNRYKSIRQANQLPDGFSQRWDNGTLTTEDLDAFEKFKSAINRFRCGY